MKKTDLDPSDMEIQAIPWWMVEAETPHNDQDSGLSGPPAACRPPNIFGPPQAVATVTTQPDNSWPWFCLVYVKEPAREDCKGLRG